MKRIKVEWMARMPQEGLPPSMTQGVVRTSFTVMSDGSIKDVVITQPSSIASFNDTAKAAILAFGYCIVVGKV
jgi:outer membrane biosynthesis protein TonB